MSDTPVILQLVKAGLAADRFYGPFANLDSANDWIAKQPQSVRFTVIMLRSPHRTRTTDDFYNPRFDYDETELTANA